MARALLLSDRTTNLDSSDKIAVSKNPSGITTIGFPIHVGWLKTRFPFLLLCHSNEVCGDNWQLFLDWDQIFCYVKGLVTSIIFHTSFIQVYGLVYSLACPGWGDWVSFHLTGEFHNRSTKCRICFPKVYCAFSLCLYSDSPTIKALWNTENSTSSFGFNIIGLSPIESETWQHQ